jgi:NADH dehydrogenase
MGMAAGNEALASGDVRSAKSLGPQRLLITGASGYIGRALVARALSQGWDVVALGRATGVPIIPWRLGETVPPARLAGADALIHLAHQWHDPASHDEERNMSGTTKLLDAAREAAIPRFVFASTVSARPDALNRYGLEKWQIEQLLKAPGEISARIGLVYGGPGHGQWGLLKSLARLPILPMVASDKSVQPIHIGELCDGLLRLAAIEKPSRATYGLAAATPLRFAELLKEISKVYYGKGLPIVPLPLASVLFMVDLVSRLVPKISRERVMGLAGLPVIKTATDLEELGLTIGPFGPTIAAARRRRNLARECQSLLHYILGQAPPKAMVRRFIRGIERHGNGMPLGLSNVQCRWPLALRLSEPLGRAGSGRDDLATRLEMAAILAESEPVGAALMYDYKGSGPVRTVLAAGGVAFIEGPLLALRFIYQQSFGRVRRL